MKRLERMRATFAKKEASENEAAQTLARSARQCSRLISPASLATTANSSGSVTTADISESARSQGLYHRPNVKSSSSDSIKLVGEYDVPIKLFRAVSANIKLVVRKEE